MSDERIDALVVRNLLDLERASKRIEHLQVIVWHEIEEMIKAWAEEQRQWHMNFNTAEQEGWFAPDSWRVPASDKEEDEFFARFVFEISDEGKADDGHWDSEFWLSQLCGLGKGSAGFEWKCAHKTLPTSKSNWKTFLREKGNLSAISDFRFQEKSGTLFLPFVIDRENSSQRC